MPHAFMAVISFLDDRSPNAISVATRTDMGTAQNEHPGQAEGDEFHDHPRGEPLPDDVVDELHYKLQEEHEHQCQKGEGERPQVGAQDIALGEKPLLEAAAHGDPIYRGTPSFPIRGLPCNCLAQVVS